MTAKIKIPEPQISPVVLLKLIKDWGSFTGKYIKLSFDYHTGDGFNRAVEFSFYVEDREPSFTHYTSVYKLFVEETQNLINTKQRVKILNRSYENVL